VLHDMVESKKLHLLVFVIAYQAQSTLARVLRRAPSAVFQDYDCEILVVDDASKDRTFEIGQEYHEHPPAVPLTVVRNEYTQGYGGNQEAGYAYAAAQKFDFVAMLHGDGRYAPKELPRLLEPLTLTQNAMLGSRLSEFHSGYRIYSVKTLESISYRLDSNGFHFDIEIIIQLLNAKKRIAELPIPTCYRDEICRVNRMKYAKGVFLATLKNMFHRGGLLFQRRFDPALKDNAHYDLKLGYPSSHTFALESIPAGSAVLDIGAGPGSMAKALLAKACKVAVVDAIPAREAGDVRVVVQNLDEPVEFDVRPYRYLLLLDIIEHLRDPEGFLERVRAQFDYQPRTLILTTPNIAFIVQRIVLLFGQFNYGKAGILDRAHTRLFTFRGVKHLLRDTG